MALHTQLPIYRTGLQLLTLAHRVQEQMPRGAKRTVGEKMALKNVVEHATNQATPEIEQARAALRKATGGKTA